MSETPPITLLLHQWRSGDRRALDEVMPHVHEELLRVARYHLERMNGGSPTVEARALVNEAYLKLATGVEVDWRDRVHFMAVCANMIRRILVDYVRERTREKRGSGVVHVGIENVELAGNSDMVSLVALDQSLDALRELDERQARIVELKFFGGLSFEEIGEILGISVPTAKRDWLMARTWLYREITGENRKV
ncbi:MAG: sigma-70 family RNA polymerase sigma factor [Acidobacteria bacterium]|nr:sigma-70 family RNA polymerase sigma factor [Acidobacteriota bacterium]